MIPPAPRTTPDLVAGIIQVQPTVDLTPFIAVGNQMTTDNCSYVSPRISYSDGFVGSQMELIERWLSAHFYTMYDNQVAAQRAGAANASYMYKVSYGLKASMYGQQAMRFDFQGNLAKLDNSTDIKRQIKLAIIHLGDRPWWGWGTGDVDFGGWWASLTTEA